MRSKEGKDAFDQFALAALAAISVFAEQECARLATLVRDELRQRRATGVYGDDQRHHHVWDEYCFEVCHGPTMGLEGAWSASLHPFLAARAEALPHPTAVLLTIAADWSDGNFEHQNGRTSSDPRITERIRNALYRLADEWPIYWDGASYAELLARRLEALLGEADDPISAMAEIAAAAERGGLIGTSNVPRCDDPFAFAMDLLLENPVAADWLSARLEYLPHPYDMAEFSDVAEHLL